ncbi:MAG: glycosyltransferase family 2 protein [Solirubrobacterales bacterium]
MPAIASTKQGAAATAGADGIRTSVILPAYNESAALPHVLDELREKLDSTYEVLVVDDGSTDHTADIAESYSCRLVRHPENRGKGAAIRTGIAQARGENVIIMDADATYPVEAIADMVDMLGENDLVRGTREGGEDAMPPINRLGNWIFNKLLSLSHGLEGTDHLSGLYGLRRRAALALGTEATGFDIETEIGIKARAHGLRIATMPINYLPRVGEKKLSPWRDGLRILGRVIVLLLIYNPWVSFILPGLLFLILSLTGAIWLSQGDVETSYLGLSIHSFIVAALGVLAAFQLTVFGIAAALYGVEAGQKPPGWLLRLNSLPFRLSIAAVAALLIVGGGGKLVQLTIEWAGDDPFTDTRALVLATTSLVLGLQILSAVLFISIFSGRLYRHDEHHLHHGDGHAPAR